MQPETKRFILDVLQAHNILTLATVREDGYPQATRVGVAARKQPPPIVPDRHRERLTRGWRAGEPVILAKEIGGSKPCARRWLMSAMQCSRKSSVVIVPARRRPCRLGGSPVATLRGRPDRGLLVQQVVFRQNGRRNRQCEGVSLRHRQR